MPALIVPITFSATSAGVAPPLSLPISFSSMVGSEDDRLRPCRAAWLMPIWPSRTTSRSITTLRSAAASVLLPVVPELPAVPCDPPPNFVA